MTDAARTPGVITMIQEKRWTVDIVIDEEEDGQRTYAEARLRIRDDMHLQGRGTARCNPNDRNVSEIGGELAVARALSDLAHELLHTAAKDIEALTRGQTHT